MARFNRQIRRSSFVKTQILPRENGDFSVILSLDDEMGNLMTLELMAPDQRQAVFLLTRALATSAELPPVVRLRGLNSSWRYRVEETGEVFGGDELMASGLCCLIPREDAASVGYVLTALDE